MDNYSIYFLLTALSVLVAVLSALITSLKAINKLNSMVHRYTHDANFLIFTSENIAKKLKIESPTYAKFKNRFGNGY